MLEAQDHSGAERSETDSSSARDGATGVAYAAGVIGALAGIVALALLVSAPAFLSPSEDATILFRYSENFARSFRISYNLNGPRTEGATDFLFMIALGLLNIAHVPPFVSACVLNAIALLATSVILQRISGAPLSLMKTLWISALLFLAPQAAAALGGFSVFLVGAGIALTAYYYLQRDDRRMGLSGLFLCLLRPDGLLITGPLMALRLAASSERSRVALTYLVLFILPGLAFFVWRAIYFSELMPLPYLVKSDTPRILGLVVASSASRAASYLLPMATILCVALGDRLRERRNLELIAALLLFPAAGYCYFRLDQNVADRFFFFAIIGTAVIVAANRSGRTNSSAILIISGLLVFGWSMLAPKWWSGIRAGLLGSRSNVHEIAADIRKHHLFGRMAVTEAGQIAYYTGWETTDLWGLNTPEFARHLPRPADVDRIGADLVVVHPSDDVDPRACVERAVKSTARIDRRDWASLVTNAIAGSPPDRYDVLLAPSDSDRLRRADDLAVGSGDYLCFFVRKQYPGARALLEILKRHGAVDGADFMKMRKDENEDEDEEDSGL